MKRRSFLVGLAVTPVVAALPLPAQASPIMESPLFGPVSIDFAHAIRVQYNPKVGETVMSPTDIARHYSSNPAQPFLAVASPVNRLRIVIERQYATHPVFDAVEAENRFFELAAESRLVASVPHRDSCCGDSPPFYILLNRAANLIASRTRRGAGNMIFMHPDNLALFDEWSGEIFQKGAAVTIGRWQEVGVFNRTMRVFTTETLDRDTCYVAYRGLAETDAAAFLISSENRLHVGIVDPGATTLGSAPDYITKVSIERFTAT